MLEAGEVLKSCPCCAGQAYVIEGSVVNDEWPNGTFFRVYCGSCLLQQKYHMTLAAAVQAWNQRVISGASIRDIMPVL
ncbi:Lar family restriction alleviation protein [Pseudomonas luteola]